MLKNKDKDDEGKARWSDNPMKVQMDRELLELRKEIERMKMF